MVNFAFSIQQAGPAQAEEAIDLIEEYYEDIGVMHRQSRSQLAALLTEKRGGIWIAREASTGATETNQAGLIGCILLSPLPRLGNAGEIKRLYVRARYRGQGVAAALMHAVEERARELGFEWLYLDTRLDLTIAIAFYERSGYQRCERYNDNPQATVFMRKQLLA